MRFDSTMSKAELLAQVKNLDARYRATIARQIDSINRLLEPRGTYPTYEHELMVLNEKLALYDMRHDLMADVLARVLQSVVDRFNSAASNAEEKRHLTRVIAMIREVIPDERSSDDVEGFDSVLGTEIEIPATHKRPANGDPAGGVRP